MRFKVPSSDGSWHYYAVYGEQASRRDLLLRPAGKIPPAARELSDALERLAPRG